MLPKLVSESTGGNCPNPGFEASLKSSELPVPAPPVGVSDMPALADFLYLFSDGGLHRTIGFEHASLSLRMGKIFQGYAINIVATTH